MLAQIHLKLITIHTCYPEPFRALMIVVPMGYSGIIRIIRVIIGSAVRPIAGVKSLDSNWPQKALLYDL
jgi:hypothetical protein